jgi:hypothetical protein
MYSSRKDSVKRHIKKVHNGTGIIVSIDYLVGRFSGFYVPAIRPTYVKKSATSIDYFDTFQREIVRVFAERTVNNYFNSPSSPSQQQAQYHSGGTNVGRQTIDNIGTTTSCGHYHEPKVIFGYRARL